MLKKEAKEITGGLSAPNKMPGPSINLPAWKCITGVKLQAVPGSVCAGCYAMKGRYRFRNVKDALNRRLNSLSDPKWVDAMWNPRMLAAPPRQLYEAFGPDIVISWVLINADH